MNPTLSFVRALFLILSFFLSVAYADNWGARAGLGLLVAGTLVGLEWLFKRSSFRSFNVVVVGLFAGYLMGQALCLILFTLLTIGNLSFVGKELVETICFLVGTYLGTVMILRASEEFYVSIPFVKFAIQAHKKKDLLLDSSCLSDPRLIDIANSGLFDYYLVLPRFLIKDLYAQAETADETTRSRAKRALDVVKKLESLPGLELRYNETDFADVKDLLGKTVRLARLIDANILSADMSRIQISSIEGVRIINIPTLSNALKPLMQTGEQIRIKIQRYGKEPRQGVGYLDDGTMVVVNGGGQYIGETIETQVLSVKHTSSGRMIFCNAIDEMGAYSHATTEDQ